MIKLDANSKYAFKEPNKLAITLTVDSLQENDYRSLAEEICGKLFDKNDRRTFVCKVLRMTDAIRSKLDPKLNDHFVSNTTPYVAHFAFAEDGKLVEYVC